MSLYGQRSSPLTLVCSLTCIFLPRLAADPRSPDCDWTTFFGQSSDKGILFHNSDHACTLTTTFRSLPEIVQEGKDSVLDRMLSMKLEASCTKKARKSASTAFLIESSRADAVLLRDADKQLSLSFSSCVWRAVTFLRAQVRLREFRHKHAEFQDYGISTRDIEGRIAVFDMRRPDVLVCCCLIVAAVVSLSMNQRQDRTASEGRLYVPVGETCFVTVHVLAHYVLEARMLHSSKAAALVSLLGLWRCTLQRSSVRTSR